MFTLCIDLLFEGESFEKSKSVTSSPIYFYRRKHLMYFALCPYNKKLLRVM